VLVEKQLKRIGALPCWKGRVELQALRGGMTNRNYLAKDGDERFVVRLAKDIPEHNINRHNEFICIRAAHAAGLAPELLFADSEVSVLRFIDGKTLAAEDVCQPTMLERLVPLLRQLHQVQTSHSVQFFWPFQIVRNYCRFAKAKRTRVAKRLPALLEITHRLEADVGAIAPVFCHNDLLPANVIDTGQRLFLIDWEYAGYGSALFDLGGLASNCGLSATQETWLVKQYYGGLDNALWQRYQAMKCASLLREATWSLVQELNSALGFDYQTYTDENFRRFEAAWHAYRQVFSIS